MANDSKAQLSQDLANLDAMRSSPTTAVNPNQKKSQKLKSKKRTAVKLLIFAAVFIGISVVIGLLSNSNSTSRTFTTYTSPDNLFSASFPGTVDVSKSTEQVSGTSVPLVEYGSDINNNTVAYMVQVVDYPSSDFDLSQASSSDELDGAINGMTSEKGASLVSKSDNEKFQGYDAKEGTLSVSQDGSTYTMYTMNFIKGNSLYTLMTIGESKDNYTKFTNSFSFN
jgi:hypothetical protein